MQVLTAMGIPLGQIREIVPDSRSRRRWGVCRQNPDGSYRIGISVRLLSDEVPLRSLQETLYHELLHTAPDCMKHTGNWKRYAEQVNRELGLCIRRTESAEEAGVPEDPRIRYKYVCIRCGGEVVRYRACSFTRHPEHYRCRRCGGSFRKVF